MSQFQKNPFYFGNTVVFTLLVLLSLGVQATPRDEVIVKSISKEEQSAALNYWTDERIEQTLAQNKAYDFKPDRVDPAGGTEMMSTGRLFLFVTVVIRFVLRMLWNRRRKALLLTC